MLAYEHIIIFAHAISQGIFTIVMVFLYRRAGKQIPGLGYWTLNIALQCITPFLFLMEGPSPFVVSYGLFSLLTFLGGLFFYFGLAEFTQTPIRKKYTYSLFSLLFLAIIMSFILDWQCSVRYILVSAGCIIFAGIYSTHLVRNFRKDHTYQLSFFSLILLYGVFALFHVMRIIYLVLNPSNPTSNLIQDAPFFIGTQLFTFAHLLGANLIILLLVSQKLLQDLSNESHQKNALLEKLKILAEKDGLTGLLNRSTIEHCLNDLFTHSGETRQGSILLFIDIDHFKKVNDTYGHEVGDRVLCHLATIFQQAVKDNGRVGRWGGDEFLIILQRRESLSAKAFSDELIEKVHSCDWKEAMIDYPLQISISCGYERIGKVETKRELLRKLDQNLYEAKSKGRNQAKGN